MSDVNVICMKWGKKYGPEYVNRLKKMVAKNLTRPHRFVCYTENVEGLEDGIEVRALPACNLPNRPEIQAWRKISLFSPALGIEGPTLFLDLDVVITGALDPLFDFEAGRFCIIHNWTQLDRCVGNSSVFRFEAGKYPSVFEEYNADPEKVVRENRTEQVYVTERVEALEGVVWWPAAWCQSFKFHSLPRGLMKIFKPSKLPEGCRVLVFHGDPNPPEAAKNWVYKGHHLMRPARWLEDYWE